MRVTWLVLAALALAAHGQERATDPVIQVDFSNPGLSPSQWIMTLHPDGTGHFRSQMGKTPSGQQVQIDTPDIDRDIRVNAGFAAQVFDQARRQKWFNEPCDSRLKVAFQGWKTFTYTGPQGQGSCTFNYSKDKDMEELGNSRTLIHGYSHQAAKLPRGIAQRRDVDCDRNNFAALAAGLDVKAGHDTGRQHTHTIKIGSKAGSRCRFKLGVDVAELSHFGQQAIGLAGRQNSRLHLAGYVQQLRCVVAEEALHGRIAVDEAALGIDGDHRRAGRVQQRFQPLANDRQRFHGLRRGSTHDQPVQNEEECSRCNAHPQSRQRFPP